MVDETEFKGLFCKIVTFDLEGEHAQELCADPWYGNIANPDKHDWLLRHLIWAAHNRKGVQVTLNSLSTDPEDMAKQREYEELRKAFLAEMPPRKAHSSKKVGLVS